MRKLLVTGIAIFSLLAALSGPNFARADEAPPVVRPAAADSRQADRITLNLPGVRLGTFLKIVAEKSRMKIVTTAEIAEKTVRVYLPDVTAEEALEAVCAAYDLHWEKPEGMDILIVKELATDFFSLEHADAKDMREVVATLVGQGGKVSFDEKNNVIAIESSRRSIEKVRAMVREVDKAPRQVHIEATIVELNEDAEKQLGIRWDVSGMARGGARLSKLPFSDAMVSVSEDAGAWTYGLISFQEFLVKLDLLERKGMAKVLATPRITAIHGTEAEIKITAHQVVAERLTRESEGLELVATEPVYADVGVVLKIVPRIHPDGKITLSVEPSVSTSARSAFFEESVDTFSRSAKTTVLVADGQTIAIGGLLREEESETVRRVPVLSRVPLLGRLFTHRDTVSQTSDLVVFLTPRLLDAERIQQDVAECKSRIGVGESSQD